VNAERLLGRVSAAGRLLLGAAFLASGFTKAVGSPQDFAFVIESYRLLPASLALPLARVLPWAELLLGAFVLTGYWLRRSALALTGLLLMFLWALLTAQARGLELGDCGCFGRLGPKLDLWQTTLLDLALLGLALAVWRGPSGRWTLDAWVEAAPEPPAERRPGRAERRR
jgi:uncharacterized membrane protein YphA (DoxX/SURF4 family)